MRMADQGCTMAAPPEHGRRDQPVASVWKFVRRDASSHGCSFRTSMEKMEPPFKAFTLVESIEFEGGVALNA